MLELRFEAIRRGSPPSPSDAAKPGARDVGERDALGPALPLRDEETARDREEQDHRTERTRARHFVRTSRESANEGLAGRAQLVHLGVVAHRGLAPQPTPAPKVTGLHQKSNGCSDREPTRT
jgi:hypothetical protein